MYVLLLLRPRRPINTYYSSEAPATAFTKSFGLRKSWRRCQAHMEGQRTILALFSPRGEALLKLGRNALCITEKRDMGLIYGIIY